MPVLRLLLGDQLTRSLSSLRDLDPAEDVILMAEVQGEATYVRHHKQKIALVLAAMRHFAAQLRDEGLRVDYIRLDDPDNSGTLAGELARAIRRHRVSRIVVTEPGEWRVLQALVGAERELGIPIDIRDDARFFCSRAGFAQWADGRTSLRMEYFYRQMRRETGFLMEAGEPAGGQWNFDHANRKRLPAGLLPPERLRIAPDPVTREVLDLVGRRFPDHFGDLEPFGWAVTRTDALRCLDAFVATSLSDFGDYQDAMAVGEPFLFHSLLSPYLNLGLLTPREVCLAAEAAYRRGEAPLNAVEGFIRQILGWREYVRGIYWLKMPDYAATNALKADRPLPWFYWSGETDLACLREAIGEIRRNAYGHHIQRLMVTGNFALLAGVSPGELEEWYLSVYADAYEWVELPNVHGMTLFADGGLLASKPYAASGAYIDRMSDYCRGCVYDPKVKLGPKACPFNYLYWAFLIRNETRLSANPRMAMPYRTLARSSSAQRDEWTTAAESFLAGLIGSGEADPV